MRLEGPNTFGEDGVLRGKFVRAEKIIILTGKNDENTEEHFQLARREGIMGLVRELRSNGDPMQVDAGRMTIMKNPKNGLFTAMLGYHSESLRLPIHPQARSKTGLVLGELFSDIEVRLITSKVFAK